MQKRMVLFLHSIEPLLASWVLLDETGIIQSVAREPLAATDADVIVVVPAQDVLLTQTTLPKLNRQRLMQALPFALEEQLLDELENLHFAVGPYQEENRVPVAVVSKQKISGWITALKSIDIAPIAIVPLTFLLPVDEKTLHINTHDDICTVRTGLYSGFTSEIDNLTTLIEINLFEEHDKDSFQSIRTKFSELQLIEKFIPELTKDFPINLLQGEFRPRPQTTQTKKIWMLAGALTAAWIGIAFFSALVSFFILHNQVSQLESETNKIYKRNFPQATAMVAPHERMEEKLKVTVAQANKNNFLAQLSLIGKAMSVKNNVHLENLEFREKQLSVEVSAGSFDNLDEFTAALTKQGLNVKRQNAAASGAQVKANLIINAGDS